LDLSWCALPRLLFGMACLFLCFDSEVLGIGLAYNSRVGKGPTVPAKIWPQVGEILVARLILQEGKIHAMELGSYMLPSGENFIKEL